MPWFAEELTAFQGDQIIFFPALLDDPGYVDRAGGDYCLVDSGRYKNAGTGGKGVGVDFDDLFIPRHHLGEAPPWSDNLPLSTRWGSPVFPIWEARCSLSQASPWRYRMSREILFFWLSVLLLGYTYLGYPVLMWAWAASRARRRSLSTSEPTVSVVIVAHNEAERIQGRLENLLSLDYPRDRLEILVGSDGSTDGTAERARAYEHAGVTVIAFETRRGKPAVLNDLLAKARGEIVVLADARQRFEAGALRVLVRHFADPNVGAVSGELILTSDPEGTAVGEGVGFYWRCEKFIRWNESRVSSTVGATGAIYAIRRELFDPIPEDTILDDVLIPIRIVRRGYRVLFEPDARAYDRTAGAARAEFAKKVRTIAGNFQLFAREPWLLSPRRNPLWLQTVSHKGLRLLTPLLHIGIFMGTLVLADQPLYRALLILQLVFYAAALCGYALRDSRHRIPILTLPYTICLLNAATIVAFFRFVTGRQPVTWEKAATGGIQ